LLARLREEVEREVDDLRGRASVTGYSKKRELEFLYPLYYFLLCCQLNGLDGQGLQSRAPDVAWVLKEYLRSLQELKAQFERLGIKGLLVSQETDIMKLLPEPTEV